MTDELIDLVNRPRPVVHLTQSRSSLTFCGRVVPSGQRTSDPEAANCPDCDSATQLVQL